MIIIIVIYIIIKYQEIKKTPEKQQLVEIKRLFLIIYMINKKIFNQNRNIKDMKCKKIKEVIKFIDYLIIKNYNFY